MKKIKNLKMYLIFFAIIGWWFGSDYLPSNKYVGMMFEAWRIKNAHPEQKVFDGEAEPPIPNFILNNFTLMGVDSNKNGIRDDVDIWINRTGIDYNERMAMRQFAKSLTQLSISCSENNSEKVVINEKKSSDDSSCLSLLSDHKRNARMFSLNELKILIQNNNERECAKFYKSHSIVTSTGLLKEPELYCEFKIENLDDEKIKYKKFHDN